jgi:hypothetical protein
LTQPLGELLDEPIGQRDRLGFPFSFFAPWGISFALDYLNITPLTFARVWLA